VREEALVESVGDGVGPSAIFRVLHVELEETLSDFG